MKNISMYDCALKAAGASVADLGPITHLSRRDFDERQTFCFRAQAPCLEYISLLIENALLLRLCESSQAGSSPWFFCN